MVLPQIAEYMDDSRDVLKEPTHDTENVAKELGDDNRNVDKEEVDDSRTSLKIGHTKQSNGGATSKPSPSHPAPLYKHSGINAVPRVSLSTLPALEALVRATSEGFRRKWKTTTAVTTSRPLSKWRSTRLLP